MKYNYKSGDLVYVGNYLFRIGEIGQEGHFIVITRIAKADGTYHGISRITLSLFEEWLKLKHARILNGLEKAKYLALNRS